MASRPIRIEVRGLADEREAAQRDLQQTLDALQDRLLPQRAARRLVQRHDPALVVTGLLAAGLALGLVGSSRPAERGAGLLAASAAGAIIYRLTR